MIKMYLTILVFSLFIGKSIFALDLNNSVWSDIANKYQIDPLILYAIALKMTPKYVDSGNVQPWPYTIHIPDGPKYYNNLSESERALEEILSSEKYHLVDVSAGLMQINIGVNGKRVDDYKLLLEPITNLKIGAEILNEGLIKAPGDIELGIGYYYSPRKKRRVNLAVILLI